MNVLDKTLTSLVLSSVARCRLCGVLLLCVVTVSCYSVLFLCLGCVMTASWLRVGPMRRIGSQTIARSHDIAAESLATQGC